MRDKSIFSLNNLFNSKTSNSKEYGVEEMIDIKFSDVLGIEQAKNEPGTEKILLAKADAG